MASFANDDRDTDAPGGLGRPLVALIAVVWGVAWALWLNGSLLLLLLGSTGVGAMAVALRVWRPRALDTVANVSPALAWLLPRLVVVVVALLAVSATRQIPAPLPDCPEASLLEDSGDLLHARLVDDTLVCMYRYTGNSL